MDQLERTATITFQASSSVFRLPCLLDDTLSLDFSFYGFTPLYHPEESIEAEYVCA